MSFSRGRRPMSWAGLVPVAAVVTVASLAAPASAQTSGGRWLFDEPAGATTAANSLGGPAGIVHSGVVTGVTGFQGNAYSFGARSSWVEVRNDASLNPGTADFSYSAYVRLTTAPSSSSVTYDVVRKGIASTSTGEFKIEVVKGGRIRCTAKDRARLRVSLLGPAGNIADGTWHHIGCSRSGSTWRATVDSSSTTTHAALGSISNTMSLSIGSKYGQQDYVPGRVDDVRLSIG